MTGYTSAIIGAYTIQAITTTLYALGVSTNQAPVFKAIIVIIIVIFCRIIERVFRVGHIG